MINAACTEKLSESLDSCNDIVRQFRCGEIDVDVVLKHISEARAEDIASVDKDKSKGGLLHAFSVLGQYEIVKALVDKGAVPYIYSNTQCTILHCAVRTYPPDKDTRDTYRAKILKLFLTSKDYDSNLVDVNQKNKFGWTALKMACRLELEMCVEVLLEHGVDTEMVDDSGCPPLHNAVGNQRIVKMVLNAVSPGAIDFQSPDGTTALLLSLEKGMVDSVMTLLERDANPNIPNDKGISPLFVAAKRGEMELVSALVKYGSKVNAHGGDQDITPLHWAAYKEMEDIALFLIERGGDVSIKDKVGRTPLSMAAPELAVKMREAAERYSDTPICSSPSNALTKEDKMVEACSNGNIHALSTLLSAGMNVNHASGDTNASLLHTAAYHGQIHVIMFLVDCGADYRALDDDGDSMLHFACMREFCNGNHEKTITILINALKADVNLQNKHGDTPLMIAIKHFLVVRAKLLLLFKADITIANSKGELPIHVASQDLRTIEVLFHLVDNTSDLNQQDHDRLTPLMHATKSNCSAIVKYLLQKGADPNMVDKHGCTALLMAALGDSPSVCQLLLAGRADPHIAGTERKITPFHIAAHKNSRTVCRVLMLNGGDIWKKDANGTTPLDLCDPHIRKCLQLAYNARKTITCELRGTPDNAPPSFDPCYNTHSLPTGNNEEGVIPCNDIATNMEGCPFNGLSEGAGASTNHTPICTTSNGYLSSNGDQRSTEVQRSTEESADIELESNSVRLEASALICNGGGVVEEKQAISKNKEVSDEEENQEAVSLKSEVECEVLTLTKAVHQLKQELAIASEDKKLLISRNKSLMDDMKRHETITVSRHLTEVVALSIHALHHGYLLSKNSLSREQTSNFNSDSVHDMSICGGNERSHDPAEKRPYRMSSHNSIDKSLEASYDLSHDTARMNGGTPTLCKLKSERSCSSLSSSGSHDEDSPFVFGGSAVHHHNSRDDDVSDRSPQFTHLQWWMVDQSQYKITGEVINSGSMPCGRFFDVYRGTFHRLDVAVGMVRGVAEWDSETYITLLREVSLLSCLHCPHVVQFLCSCFDPSSKTCSIVSEYMYHGSLHSVLHEAKLSLEWKDRLRIVTDVSRGMAFLHSHHLLHRSLAPRNILIGEHFNAKLNDFGFYETKLKNGFFNDVRTKCHPLQVYFAPEAWEGSRYEFNQTTDVYSFGIVMFECGTGKRVFSDQQIPPLQLNMRILMGARPAFKGGVDLDYKKTAEKCWNKDPNMRPSFDSVTSELQELYT